ncbi:hypothetical protein DL95DRAFT_152634 [Leptodontidium sp. 2 PMI_412]|nr:hypothetical protein DL95DRAFT_152634 [Leptodontidium sp. 2 PMI_412]
MQSSNLTIGDILCIHRQWITKLYAEDNRTEAEIVRILHNRRLPATLSQIHDCLIDWEVIPSTPADTIISSPAPSRTYATADRLTRDLYTKRPLPSVPAPNSSKRKHIYNSNDSLKVTCRHRPQPPKVETIFDSVPEKSSPQEAYTSTE